MKTRTAVSVVFTLLFLALVAVPAARAESSDVKHLRGFVDGAAFGELAGEEGEIVEVNLGPSLLDALARGASSEPGAPSVLTGLRSVTAYILDLKQNPELTARASKLVEETQKQLERQGWERIALVREKNERVAVYILSPDKTIDGLVVLVIDQESGEVVFANLAGSIDLAKLGAVGNTLHVPGLDAVKKGKDGVDAAEPSDGKDDE